MGWEGVQGWEKERGSRGGAQRTGKEHTNQHLFCWGEWHQCQLNRHTAPVGNIAQLPAHTQAHINTTPPHPGSHQPNTTATHLELVAECAECLLELGNGLVVELLLPVEGGGAVVGQQLARELLMNGLLLCWLGIVLCNSRGGTKGRESTVGQQPGAGAFCMQVEDCHCPVELL